MNQLVVMYIVSPYPQYKALKARMQKGTPTLAEIRKGYEERECELTKKEHPLIICGYEERGCELTKKEHPLRGYK